MVAVALAFAVLEVGGSASAVGLVLACATLPLVATVLVGGVVADRVSRRLVMVGADLVRVASQGTMAGLLITGTAELWMLALLAGVTGAATGFFNPASTGLLLSGAGMMIGMSVWESTLRRHIPDESLSRVSSYDWFGSFAFYPLGLALWGTVAAAIGIGTALWLAFGLFVAAILSLLAVPDIWRLPANPAPMAIKTAAPAPSPHQ